MAVVARGEPQRAVDELERAVDTCGFRSIMLPSSAGGQALDDDIFSLLFSFIDRRGMLVFMHPTLGFPSTRFSIIGMKILVGWPFEMTLAITRLIFACVFEWHPELKFIRAHGGGDLMFLRGQLDAAYNATGWEAHPYYRNKITRPPTYYLGRLYYDTCPLSVESIQIHLEYYGTGPRSVRDRLSVRGRRSRGKNRSRGNRRDGGHDSFQSVGWQRAEAFAGRGSGVHRSVNPKVFMRENP